MLDLVSGDAGVGEKRVGERGRQREMGAPSSSAYSAGASHALFEENGDMI